MGKSLTAVVHDGLWCAFENIHMGEEAEIIAEKFAVTREEQDQFSLQSHQRAAAATAAGRFKEEIVPVEVKQKKGVLMVDTDEPIRGDSYMDTLTRLMPVFKQGGTVTAGNAPGLSDGASATVVVDQDFARANGLTVLARITGYASAAITPRYVFAAPTRAVKRLLERTGLEIERFRPDRGQRSLRRAGSCQRQGTRLGLVAGERQWWRHCSGPSYRLERLARTDYVDSRTATSRRWSRTGHALPWRRWRRRHVG